MGEDEGVRKRRMFQWPKQARDLAKEYKQRVIGQNLGQADRGVLVARLVEISGKPAGSMFALLVPFRHSTKALLSRMDQTGARTASRPNHYDAGG